MATLSFAVVVCIFLLVKGTDAQAAGKPCIEGGCDDPTGTGGAIICEEGTSTCKMNAGLPCNTTTPCLLVDTCEDGTCKIRVDGSCYSGIPDPNCIAHAECPDNKCLCKQGFTATTDKTVCAAEVMAEPVACGDTGPCASDATCEDETCKTKITTVDEDCSVADKACDPTTLVCQDKKCKKKIGQLCSTTAECVAGAECPSEGVKQCSCTGGLAASLDMTKCGAMGVAASMLLVMATFVTSRFF